MIFDLIGKACLNPTVNTGLAALNNSNSNLVLVVRDGFDSSGRIYQEYKRSSHGGRESLIEELTTTGVWGLGIPFGKKVVDWVAPKLSSNFLTPNLDLRLFNADNIQKLDAPTVEKYFKHLDPKTKGNININDAKAKLLEMANHATNTVGQSLINKNRMFQLAKVGGVGLAASAFLGYEVPRINQCLTRKKVDQEQSRKAAAAPLKPAFMKSPQAMNTAPVATAVPSRNYPAAAMTPNPFSAAPVTSFGAQQNGLPPFPAFNTVMPSPGLNPSIPPANKAIKFGSLGHTASTLLQKLQENDQLGTALFSDLPLSSGRVVTARNKDEKIEKLFKEAALILTLFVIQQRLEDFFAGEANHIGYPALKKMHDDFVKAAGSNNFHTAYAQAKTHLGLDEGASLASYFENKANPTEALKTLVQNIRDHYNIDPVKLEKPAANLLYDMAELSGKIPTHLLDKEKMLKHIDITKEIDLDGVKAVANHLDQIATALISKKGQTLSKQLTQTASHKLGAFAGSAMICWGIMSYAIPKVQHYITYKRTGKDFFPGVQLKTS